MTEITYAQAIKDAMSGGDAPRSEGLPAWRGRWPLRRRIRGVARHDRRVRSRADPGHAHLRGGDHGVRRGCGHDGDAADSGDHVQRFHHDRDGPAREPGGQGALPVRRPGLRAHGAAHARGLRHGRGGPAFAERRVMDPQCPRAQGRCAVHARRCEGAAEGEHP